MIKIYINNHVVSLTNEFIKNRNKAGIWPERYKPSMCTCYVLEEQMLVALEEINCVSYQDSDK